MTEYHRVELPVKASANVPTPAAGKVALFADSGNANRLSQKDSSGAVIDLAATGGGGGGAIFQAATLTVDVPGGTVEWYETVVAAPGVSADSYFIAQFSERLDPDNDLESIQDDNMAVYLKGEAGQIRATLVGNGAFNGTFTFNYLYFNISL